MTTLGILLADKLEPVTKTKLSQGLKLQGAWHDELLMDKALHYR